MRRFVTALLLGVVLGQVAVPGAAFATDQQTFNRLMEKSAPNVFALLDSFKPKFGCACIPSGERGVLAENVGLVNCFLPIFNANGEVTNFSACLSQYVVLPK
jgi:hypothetical protein